VRKRRDQLCDACCAKFYCVKLCVAGRSKSNVEVRRLDLKRTYSTASEHNAGGHLYVEVSFRLKDSHEKSEYLTSEKEKNDDENGSGKRIRG
jgi:hypothetical protein